MFKKIASLLPAELVKKTTVLLPIGLVKFFVKRRYRSFPEIHAIELTNHCPFKCVMCPRTFDMTRALGYMDFPLFKSLVDQVAESGVQMYPIWLHQMGESLVHPELVEFIEYATSKGVPTGLSLNPFMLKKEKSERLARSGIKKLLFSLDGVDNKSFEQFRGLPNAFDKSVENLEYILEYIFANKLPIETTLSMIGFKGTKPLMEQYREKFAGFKTKVIMKHFVNWGGSLNVINDLENTSASKQYKEITCMKPWFSVTVNWEGNVLPCCLDYDGICKLGNAHHQSLSEIWTNSTVLKELRSAFENNDASKISLCANCSELHTRHADDAG